MLSRSALLALLIFSSSATYSVYSYLKKKKMTEICADLFLENIMEENDEIRDDKTQSAASSRSASFNDLMERLDIEANQEANEFLLSLSSTAESCVSASYLIGQSDVLSTASAGCPSFADSMPKTNESIGSEWLVRDVTPLIDPDETQCSYGYSSDEDGRSQFITKRRHKNYSLGAVDAISFGLTDSASDILEKQKTRPEVATPLKSIRRHAGTDLVKGRNFVTPMKPRNMNMSMGSLSKYANTPSKVYNYTVPTPIHKPFNRHFPAPQPDEYPLENRASRLRRMALEKKKQMAESSTCQPWTGC